MSKIVTLIIGDVIFANISQTVRVAKANGPYDPYKESVFSVAVPEYITVGHGSLGQTLYHDDYEVGLYINEDTTPVIILKDGSEVELETLNIKA